MNENKTPKTPFALKVQSVFNTPYGKELFVQMAIMSDYFTNSLVATARLRTNVGCEHPNIYFNAQKDLASKLFNELTHDQFGELRKGVIEHLISQPKKGEK